MRIAALTSLAMAGPTYDVNSGHFDTITDNGAGDNSLNLIAARGFDAAECAILTSPRGALVASGLRSIGVVHTDDVTKRITSATEAAMGAASALGDGVVDIAVIDGLGGGNRGGGYEVVAAGSIAFAAGAPSEAVASGALDATTPITDTGAGDITLNTLAARGWDATECVMLFTPRAVIAASGLVAVSVAHTSDIAKRITILQEQAAGAASALADVDFDWIAIAPRRKKRAHARNGWRLWAWGSILNNAGVPEWRAQSGAFANAITDTGAGDWTVTLQDWRGVDATECVVIASPRGAVAASGNRSVGVTHTSDVAKRLTLCQEAAMGAASARGDFDVDLAIWTRSR